MLHVIATVVAKKESIEKVKEIIEGMIEPTRAEKGCVQYDLLQSDENSAVFVLVERWETSQDLDAHKSTPRFAQMINQLTPIHESLDIKLLHKVK
ncbi:hypothetical protein CYY_005853 [Polysphondylium violaceum]|uniref:ABM domain-containing protein n=1 Tax=Polysphondylium violaceum TaxID=133409 RepID=A0A8J4V3R7_9MYCE|nr:hypothetical protein CYY_005853 [Polysphondylium violaceum]